MELGTAELEKRKEEQRAIKEKMAYLMNKY